MKFSPVAHVNGPRRSEKRGKVPPHISQTGLNIRGLQALIEEGGKEEGGGSASIPPFLIR